MIDKQTLKRQYLEVHGRPFLDPDYNAFMLLCGVLEATGDSYQELTKSIYSKIRFGITPEQKKTLNELMVDNGLEN